MKGRGKGKTASRYVPTLNVLDLAAMGKFPELLHANGAVEGNCELLHDNKTVPQKLLHPDEAVDAELLHANGAKTPILDLRTTDPHGQSNGTSAAPATAGLAAAEPASGGFERIWLAYDKLGNKKASRAAFAAVENPDVDHIAERAAAWAASAKPGQKRMPLEKWLAAEKYDEADRRIAPKERKAKPQPIADNDEPAVEWKGELTPHVMPGNHKVTVTGASETLDGAGRLLTLFLNIDDGSGSFLSDVPTSFHVEHADKAIQDLGQERLLAITGGGGDGDQEAADLVGCEFRIRVAKDGAVIYRPLTYSASPGLMEKITAARSAGMFSGEREVV